MVRIYNLLKAWFHSALKGPVIDFISGYVTELNEFWHYHCIFNLKILLMGVIIWVPWELRYEGNKNLATGYESRRAAYRAVNGENVAMVQVEIIPKKFVRSEKPVPKKNGQNRKKKKRK